MPKDTGQSGLEDTEFVHTIMIRDKVVDKGSLLYIKRLGSAHKVMDIQILPSKNILIWCIIRNRLIPFNEKEVFDW